ncbi:MAG: nuclear transport factor 2 family protein [Candidatus Geothermincolia bacterium]
MHKPGQLKWVMKIGTVVVLALALSVPLLAAGCGAQTPEQAVRGFYKAIETHNWNAYLSSVLPDNVRRMTEVDMRKQKKEFLATDFTYKGLKLKTNYDPKNKNKADVELQAGVISGKNPTTGKTERTTIAEIKKNYGVTPAIGTQKFKGTWYVDVPLAAVDQPTQTQ